MTYFSTEPASERRNVTGKNRVWDFFRLSNETHPAKRRQPAQPRRKIRPTATKPASGIPYWPSRDPIGENGGENLYGFVGNDCVDTWDYLGREEKRKPDSELTEQDYVELKDAAIRKLSGLCEIAKCLGKCGCSKEDCQSEAKRIAEGVIAEYKKMANHPNGWGSRPGNSNNDKQIHRGWMCFHWQAIMYDAIRRLSPKCFRIGGGSHVIQDQVNGIGVSHSWVDMALWPRTFEVTNDVIVMAPSECRLRLDAWKEYAPKLYSPDEHGFEENFVSGLVLGPIQGGYIILPGNKAETWGTDHSARWPAVLPQIP